MGLAHSPRIVTNGLIMYLDAANPKSYSGSGTTWADLSGRGNHCTLYNNPTFTTSGVRKYFLFDGVNDYIRTTNTLNLSTTNAVTINHFIKVLYGDTVKILHELTNDFNLNVDGFVSAFSDDSIIGFESDVTAATKGNVGYNIGVYPATLLSGNKWKSHCIIHDTSQSSTENLIYSNGSLAIPLENPYTSSPGLNSNNTNNFKNDYLYICSRGGSSLFSSVELAAVLIYNRTLSASEISQNFNALRGRFGI